MIQNSNKHCRDSYATLYFLQYAHLLAFIHSFMLLNKLPRKLVILTSALMIIAGLWLGLWSLGRLSLFDSKAGAQTAIDNRSLSEKSQRNSATIAPVETGNGTRPPNRPASSRQVEIPVQATSANQVDQESSTIAPIYLPLNSSIPADLRNTIERLAATDFEVVTSKTAAEPPTFTIDLTAADGIAIYEQYFVAATRFDTIMINDATQNNLARVQQIWRSEFVEGEEDGALGQFTALGVLSDTLPALITLLGGPESTIFESDSLGKSIEIFASVDALSDAVYDQEGLLALLPFDQLEPRLQVIPINGQNPVENAFRFAAEAYPLRVTYYLHSGEGSLPNNDSKHDATSIEERSVRKAFLAQLPTTNRDPARLTVLAMTGVTAMVRLTAAQMDKFGNAWPADIVGTELSAADITHISNEVPFVVGCQTDISPENLTFCSKPEYMAALDAVGVDIIGLTGNHQNDYGVEDALASLQIYADAGLPIYGGGKNKEEAFAPLYLEHNGNRLAFLGANSFGPTFAWATDDSPGSAEFDLAIMSATIRAIKEKGLADLVIVDLQYEESYNVTPLANQREDFNALIRAGADIVTGVQSHVPQAVEFTEGHIILYGLGNLFFDQMWSQETRDALIAKHTFYSGRHISTQLLTTILQEYGQPHWASPAERERILQRVYSASYWE